MKWEGEEESSNVEDRRGSGFPTKGLVIGGGGGVTILIVIVAMLLGVDPSKLLNQNIGDGSGNPPAGVNQNSGNGSDPGEEDRSLKFSKTILAFTEKVWDEEFDKIGKQYEKPHMVLFSQEVDTHGCGVAPSAVGPFYCPADRTVYLDPSFFDELEGKLGGSKAEFSQAYVIAHEVGHHVQNLLGYSELVDRKRHTVSKDEFHEWSVRLELQADYLAGVWANHGQQKFHFLESGDVESAIKTANSIGDDRLQKRATGFVSPEKFTHGTSAQRVKWFKRGFETGDLREMKKIFELPYKDL
jgi:predicted metalloprotease